MCCKDQSNRKTEADFFSREKSLLIISTPLELRHEAMTAFLLSCRLLNSATEESCNGAGSDLDSRYVERPFGNFKFVICSV
jgi:hypothetical protein